MSNLMTWLNTFCREEEAALGKEGETNVKTCDASTDCCRGECVRSVGIVFLGARYSRLHLIRLKGNKKDHFHRVEFQAAC